METQRAPRRDSFVWRQEAAKQKFKLLFQNINFLRALGASVVKVGLFFATEGRM